MSIVQRLRFWIACIAFVAVGLGAVWTLEADSARAESGGAEIQFGFGMRFAGVYLTEVEADPDTAFLPFTELITFHADGTLITAGEDDFGTGDIAARGFQGPEHGVWRRSGPRQVASTTLENVYDANGALQVTLKIRSRIDVPRDFESLSGRAEVDVFVPGQDPLADAPVATVVALFTGRRLQVE